MELRSIPLNGHRVRLSDNKVGTVTGRFADGMWLEVCVMWEDFPRQVSRYNIRAHVCNSLETCHNDAVGEFISVYHTRYGLEIETDYRCAVHGEDSVRYWEANPLDDALCEWKVW